MHLHLAEVVSASVRKPAGAPLLTTRGWIAISMHELISNPKVVAGSAKGPLFHKFQFHATDNFITKRRSVSLNQRCGLNILAFLRNPPICLNIVEPGGRLSCSRRQRCQRIRIQFNIRTDSDLDKRRPTATLAEPTTNYRHAANHEHVLPDNMRTKSERV